METETLTGPIEVVIRGMRLESASVASFELVSPTDAALPPFAPGAHVEVAMPSGHTRSYSLVARTADGRGYCIAVKRDPASRGGSVWLHDVARLGMALRISAPKNDFPLVEDAACSVFMAGGIGITPMLAMLQRLSALGRPWQLHYAAPSAGQMAYREQVEQLAGTCVFHAPDAEAGRMDVAAVVAAAPPGAHLYCCGPARMLDDFLAATAGRPANTVHYERFVAAQGAATDGGFRVKLARDGRCLPVPAGRSVLDVLLDAGLDVPYACTQGVCGSCQVPVLAGTPDHRDSVLTDEEKAANTSMLVCCSGALSEELTLDL